MPFILIFLGELLLLASLSSYSSGYFLRFFYSVTGSEKAAVILFSVLFFPGTFIHELAHWLMARILFVQASGMEFLPKMEGNTIKLGSVSITKTDPIRRLLIGVAPVIVGLIVLLGTLWNIQIYFSYFAIYPWWIWLSLGYVVFVIGSTMFSSRKDLEGSLGVIISTLILIVVFYLVGFDWVLGKAYLYIANDLNDFFKQISLLLLIPIGANILIGLIGWSATKRM